MSKELENKLKDLREKNNELVMKVQYWKMTAAQKENEKLDLMKEMNELRLKLNRLRSGGAAHARKLDAAVQSASEDILSHLVQASTTVAHMLELKKTYMQDREELETAQPRWSNLSNTPSSEKVNRVPPMLIGGRLIQPVVSLSRTLQSNITRSSVRSPNQQNNLSDRTVFDMHTLQDVYIPLTRIDAHPLSHSTPMEDNDSADDLGLEDSSERILEEPENMSDSEDFDESQRLEAVIEDVEPGETPQRPRQENPLEGPSWLLDEPMTNRRSKSLMKFEPDSTTEVEENNTVSGTSNTSTQAVASGCSFTPTVRRRRRSPASTPPSPADTYSPRPGRRTSNGRILKVLVAKMCLEDDGSGDASPPKRPNVEETTKLKRSKEKSPKRKPNKNQGPIIREMSPSKRLMRFDAPSPNGSTDSRVIVLETPKTQPEPLKTPNQSTRQSRDAPSGSNEDAIQTHSRVSRDTQNNTRVSHDTQNNTRVSHDTQNNTRVSHDTQSNSRVSHDTQSNSRVSHDTQNNTRVSHDTQSNSRVSHDTQSNSRVSHDTQNNTRVSHDTQSNSRVSHDTQSNSRVSHDTQNNTRVSHDTQNNTRVSHDTQSNSRVSHDTQNNSRVSHDTQSNSRVSHDTQNNSRVSHDTQSNSRVSHDTQNNTRVSHDTQTNTRVSHDTQNNTRVSHDTQNNTRVSHDTQNNSRVSHDTQSNSRVSRDTGDSQVGGARESRDSDSSGSEKACEGRTRRARKAVVYKERSLIRKLRR